MPKTSHLKRPLATVLASAAVLPGHGSSGERVHQHPGRVLDRQRPDLEQLTAGSESGQLELAEEDLLDAFSLGGFQVNFDLLVRAGELHGSDVRAPV